MHTSVHDRVATYVYVDVAWAKLDGWPAQPTPPHPAWTAWTEVAHKRGRALVRLDLVEALADLATGECRAAMDEALFEHRLDQAVRLGV